MDKEYLSVKEFAEAAGVSYQTIYKQLNSRLEPYVTMIKGQKMIKTAALKEFYEVEEDSSTDIQQDTTQINSNSTSTQPNSTDIQPTSTKVEQPKSTQETEKKDAQSLDVI